MLRVFALLLAAFLLACVEWAFVPFLPPFLRVHPGLPVVVMLAVTTRRRWSTAFALAFGVTVDLLSVARLELATVRMVAIAVFVQLVLRYILTNRSVYAVVALGLVARIVDWVLVRLGTVIASVLESTWFGPAVETAWVQQLLWDGFLLIWLFIFFATFTQRLTKARSWTGYADD